MAARSSSHATLNGDLSSSNISRLESLPAEVVTAIGNHLDLADLGLFRKTSKTMCERLNFNLKKYVKVIRYWPMQPMFDALSKFQTQPLAKAMDSCIWLRIITLDPPGEDESEEEFLDLDNSSNEEEIRRDSQDAAFLPASPALPDSDQKRLIPLSLSGFPSLKITRTWILAFGLPDVVEPSFASAVTHEKLCRALPSITPLPITLENLPTMASIKRLSKFETLSDELVNAVAKYLGNHDTMELRKTSKKMRDHLYSNTKVQACFKELEIPFASWEFLDMRILMKTPLASAVKSLMLFKTDDSDQIDQMMAFGSNVGDGNMATPGIRRKGGKVVIENAEEMAKALKERPQRLFADLVNDGFPNLTTIDFVCGKNLPLAQAGSLRDPRADDFEFLAKVLKRTTQSLNVSLSYEKGSFRLMWAGSYPSTHTFWFEGYSDELLHPVTGTYLELRQATDYFMIHQDWALPVLNGHALRSLQLHRTVLSTWDLRIFIEASSVSGPLESLMMTQCEIYAGREGEEHRFFTHKKSPLKTSLRKLGLSHCLSHTVPWVRVFKAFRKYTQLEKIVFEKIVTPTGLVRFDWDGNGALDDGSRLPSIQTEIGIKAALNKMVECCEAVPAPLA
ncbi:hypothetical protein IWX47DRAFT_918950 [Phyllosticta citricarpa]